MAEPLARPRVTPEEYLAFERAAPERHELIDELGTALRIEHYHRQPQGGWLLREYGPGDTLRIESLACELAVDAVYRRVLISARGR